MYFSISKIWMPNELLDLRYSIISSKVMIECTDTEYSLDSSILALCFWPTSILSKATNTDNGFELLFLRSSMLSLIDFPEDITSSTINDDPSGLIPTKTPASP